MRPPAAADTLSAFLLINEMISCAGVTIKSLITLNRVFKIYNLSRQLSEYQNAVLPFHSNNPVINRNAPGGGRVGGMSVWRLHVLSTSVWVLAGYSSSSHSPNACILGLGDLTGDSKVVGGVNVSVTGQMAFPSWVQQFQQPVRSVKDDCIDMKLYMMLTSKKSSR